MRKLLESNKKMNNLCVIPFTGKLLNHYLEDEKYFLKGLFSRMKERLSQNEGKNPDKKILELLEILLEKSELILPIKNTERQIRNLQEIAKELTVLFSKVKLSSLDMSDIWIPLVNGFLGKVVNEKNEIAIILYLISAIYQNLAQNYVQTSIEYRYYHVSAFSAIKGALNLVKNAKNNSQGFQEEFKEMLVFRELEIKAELVKSGAFLARKKGDFEQAAKLFAGAASFRFSMMNYDISDKTLNQLKFLASTELGMACFYLAVGLTNKDEQKQAELYLFKAKSYFKNTVKLSANDKDLLEAANKRLELVNPYIDRVKKDSEIDKKAFEKLQDPQPLLNHPNPPPLFTMDDRNKEISRICSNCFKKIPWEDKCSECGEELIPIK
jgi:hypothetical protein